ncbi:caspase, EACC1-associated type [Nocardia vulneris]|uniref:caspase, EACC1-associated type n=1 Tax=Nocardia vulneris TaxID=1141657 RepID=UPI0006901760|nr:tetratricopeptide repeat protein [Nocardia vulneris]
MTAAPRSGWRAVLVGVSRYSHPGTPDIPAAANNVADLAELLTAVTGTGLADDHCSVLIDPGDSGQVGKAVRNAALEAEEVLVVYYTGHGMVDDRGRLHLALPNSDRDHLAWSSVPFATLREELTRSSARARVLILDCCFSGRAFEAMSSSASVVDGQLDLHGTYTMVSSSADETSFAPEGYRNTAFTAALLNAAAGTDYTLDELYQQIDRLLRQRGHPSPRRRSVNVAGDLRIFSGSQPADIGDPKELFERGLEAADHGDLLQAESSWRKAASQGHPGAMNNLGNLLTTRRKTAEAHDWYRKAAEQGSLVAMVNLANLLHRVKEFNDAKQWWRRAAEFGNADAMHNLAVALDKSLHIDEAIAWYEQAARAGHTDSMHNLAIRLRYLGQLKEATGWWHRAGHRHAQRANEKPRGLVVRRPSR